ncbi:glycosyltransferase family 52 [Vibrio sp.]|uniref:glycosyltransferase family 52 n=1 Tax=Vibrio sp. TaxID=678 RepID=UPI00311D656A
MNDVFVCKTTWELFVTLVMAFKKHKETNEKTVIILEWAEENKDYIPKLRKLKCIQEVEVIKLNQSKIAKGLLFHYRCHFSLKRKLSKYISQEYDINVFVDQSVISQTFIKSGKTLKLFEHGNGNYLVGAYPNYKFIKRVLGVTEGYGRDESITKIFLQYPEKAPEDIYFKVVSLNIKNDFESIEELQKKEIFGVFDVEGHNLKEGVLLLTQPLSEDGIISESEKLSLYQEFIDKYSDIIIKPHPRDTTDYNKYLSGDFSIISKSFPIEILNFTDARFDTLCTVCSGSVYNFSYPVNVDIYGTMHSKNMIRVLGEIEKRFVSKNKYSELEYV